MRWYVNKGLATFYESLKRAGHEGLTCKDPSGEMRKVYPLPCIFACDLGEQHSVSGVLQHRCAVTEVPRHGYADLRAYRTPPPTDANPESVPLPATEIAARGQVSPRYTTRTPLNMAARRQLYTDQKTEAKRKALVTEYGVHETLEASTELRFDQF